MPHEENFALSFRYLTVPRWWFEQIGYWGAPGTPPADDPVPRPIMPINVPTEDSRADYLSKYPRGLEAAYPSPFAQQRQQGSKGPAGAGLTELAAVGALCGLLGMALGVGGALLLGGKKGYLPIN